MRHDFMPGVDQLEFSHSTFATVAEVLNNAQQSGSDVVIAHDPQDVVTLNNILLAICARPISISSDSCGFLPGRGKVFLQRCFC
jgi:hypothetical protein